MPPKSLPFELVRALEAMRLARTSVVQAFNFDLSSQNRALACRPGCAHCCAWPVDVSILEGVDLCHYLMAENRWTTGLREKVRETADIVTGLTFQVWLHSGTPCVFLGTDNLCTVYTHRPFGCQCTVSTGLPEYCQTPHLNGASHIVSRTTHLMTFRNMEEEILRVHRLKMLTMPLATALLAAEPICLGNMELRQADSSIFAEHLGRL